MRRQNRPRPLRRRLMVPLGAAFAALWLGTMALFTGAAVGETERTVDLQYEAAAYWLDLHGQGYQASLTDGIGTEAEAASAYRQILSGETYRLQTIGDGGMAAALRDGDGGVLRSQLAWGFGNETGLNQGQRWYLELDSALDGEGQLALARWIGAQGENTGTFRLYPQKGPFSGDCTDGSYARVTGFPRPGHTIAVQKLELVRPDGTVETVVETGAEGTGPITVELGFLELRTVLDSGTEAGNRRRLSNFQEAQAILDRALAGEEPAVQTGGGRIVSGAVSLAEGDLTYYAAGQCSVAAAVWEGERGFYLATFALLALVVLLLSRRLSQTVAGPVEALGREVQAGRCQTGGPISELNALAAAFNAAQEQLERQLERERDFTRAAAHELKTPLAILQAHGEALREDILPEKRAEYLDVILDECGRMSALVGRLLELSRLESGNPLQKEPLDLAALVREVWEPLALPLEQKDITLKLDLETLQLEGDRERLREAAGNLASNALRHCTPGGTIRVTLRREGSRAVLTVYNDGEPIPEADLPHLFQPFYRGGDKSRSRDSGGTGLGLAIVRAAVLAHGGECEAENTGGGAAFRLVLPLEKGTETTEEN